MPRGPVSVSHLLCPFLPRPMPTHTEGGILPGPSVSPPFSAPLAGVTGLEPQPGPAALDCVTDLRWCLATGLPAPFAGDLGCGCSVPGWSLKVLHVLQATPGQGGGLNPGVFTTGRDHQGSFFTFCHSSWWQRGPPRASPAFAELSPSFPLICVSYGTRHTF